MGSACQGAYVGSLAGAGGAPGAAWPWGMEAGAFLLPEPCSEPAEGGEGWVSELSELAGALSQMMAGSHPALGDSCLQLGEHTSDSPAWPPAAALAQLSWLG